MAATNPTQSKPQGDIQKTDRVMKAVMQMKKLDIAELKKAAEAR